jgi:16S rRNA (cytidine1402-2'-O)-methyltransferase
MPRPDDPDRLERTYDPKPGLYVVATPIGNARDITLRALDVLRAADLVACEDTRVTRKLFAIHGIERPLVAYHEHNAARVRPTLLRRLAEGASLALVSDAGMPLVSDPGYRLVREAAAAGIAVTAVPGPSAPLAALCVAGLPTYRFLFAGFLPPRSAARRAALAELAGIRATLIFFEAARRLPDALADMRDALGGGREAAVARELTKLFEEVRRAPLAELAAEYAHAGPPKGELVIVVGPPAEAGRAAAALDQADIDAALRAALADLPPGEAASAVARTTGCPRRELYRRAVALKGDGGR